MQFLFFISQMKTLMMDKLFSVLFFLVDVWILTRGDAEVSCQFGQSCILPCRFPPGDHLGIYWVQLTPTQAGFHSYYDNKDQLRHQDQRFRGRTSLFQDQISKGNASLQLTGVKVQDEGSYRCLTSTITETGEFDINMKVYAPPQKINMNQAENQIICSSDGIYPQPDLSWSISPPSSRTFQNTTRVQKTEELLYNISSSLTLSDGEDDLDYICTISTPSNQRRASWRRGPSVKIISGEATISCSASDSSLKGFSLVWSFNQNQMIVTKKEDEEQRVSEEWKQHVKDVSESGRLTLQHLSADHEGTYTCEVSKDEETNITQVSLSPAEESNNPHVRIIIVLTVIGISAVVIALVFFCRRRRRNAQRKAAEVSSVASNTEIILTKISEFHTNRVRNNKEQSGTTSRNNIVKLMLHLCFISRTDTTTKFMNSEDSFAFSCNMVHGQGGGFVTPTAAHEPKMRETERERAEIEEMTLDTGNKATSGSISL
ncbi:CD276 antigen-like isoform X1 [Oryzias latipes]|uniref:Ig-like domain-containing protein n=1 Tax=Oryzias latipes TaxID=8090 RepID=A0A3B3I6T0_ORYLA